MTRPLEIAVLVSVGRHPASGRARRADLDARALEMALGLAPPEQVHVVHVGDPQEPALRDYLGMGIASLTVLAIPPRTDPLPALVEHLEDLRPGLVLTGTVAEAGLCSGQLPYALAVRFGRHPFESSSPSGVFAGPGSGPGDPAIQSGADGGLGARVKPGQDNGENGRAERGAHDVLDYALASNIVAIEASGEGARMLQTLTRGRRRVLEARLPLIATVDRAAPAARASAYGPARRGQIEVGEAEASADALLATWCEQPARRRPKRLRVASGNAAERLKSATEMQAGRGQLLRNPPPDEAAEAIWDYLVSEGIVRPG